MKWKPGMMVVQGEIRIRLIRPAKQFDEKHKVWDGVFDDSRPGVPALVGESHYWEIDKDDLFTQMLFEEIHDNG